MRKAKRSSWGLTRRAVEPGENFITCQNCNMSHFVERRDVLVPGMIACLSTYLNRFINFTSLIYIYKAV